MKIFLSADIEGVSGVIHRELAMSGSGDYERGRRLMTQEVNAAIQGAIDAGADEVLVNDSHGSMRNLILEELHPEARLITGYPKPLLMMEGIDASFDGAVFIGYHAMAGTSGVMAHTIDGFTFGSIKMNGVEYGETGVNAAVAGYFGVPVLMVSGDNCLKEEISAVLPAAEFAVVKVAHGNKAANCLSPQKARQLITETVARAIVNKEKTKPFTVDGPIELEIGLQHPSVADVVAIIPGVKRLSAMAVTYQAADIIEAMRLLTTMMNAASVLDIDIFK